MLWIGNDLPDDVTALLRYKLLIQGRRLYDFAVASEGRWWSSSYWQNHNRICYAGLATAGYVLGKEEWTERAKSNLATVLEVMPEDGSHAEGVVYWRYGVPFLAIHLDLLAEAEGVDWWDRGGFMANTFGTRTATTSTRGIPCLRQARQRDVPVTAAGPCHVVAATLLELAGRALLDVTDPYTGKVG